MDSVSNKSLQDVLPIIAQCLEGIQRCTDSMDEKEVKNNYTILFFANALFLLCDADKYENTTYYDAALGFSTCC